MKAKDIVICIAVVALLTATILVVKNNRDAKLQESLKGTPTIEQKVEEKFGGLQVPADVEKTELKDVSGGDGLNCHKNRCFADYHHQQMGHTSLA